VREAGRERRAVVERVLGPALAQYNAECRAIVMRYSGRPSLSLRLVWKASMSRQYWITFSSSFAKWNCAATARARSASAAPRSRPPTDCRARGRTWRPKWILRESREAEALDRRR
jgi:hypothetical protein